MKKLFECETKIDNLEKVIEFVEGELAALGCGLKQQVQITVAVEEIYVNIAHYAYAKLDENGRPIPDTGTGNMELELEAEAGKVRLSFMDRGTPFNPLSKDDPDITLSADERDIGGLGIFMVKKSMDEVLYKHQDGKNILTMIKSI